MREVFLQSAKIRHPREMSSHKQQSIYDEIGEGYRQRRQPDPRFERLIRDAIGAATSVCNVGAGTGSYEPCDSDVVAVEPSLTMIRQRPNQANVVQAVAEHLPFRDKAFDVAMTILSVHHWQDPIAGLREMVRIAPRQVVFTFDARFVNNLWLARDYLPEMSELERKRALPMAIFVRELVNVEIRTVLVPHDCRDGFQGAYWRRPEMYLDASIRSSMSSFSKIPEKRVQIAMERLRCDLADGTWHEKHRELLNKQEIDLGYRLIVAGSRSS